MLTWKKIAQLDLKKSLQLVKPDEDNPPEEAEKECVEIGGDANVPWDSKELAPIEVQFFEIGAMNKIVFEIYYQRAFQLKLILARYDHE